MKIKFLGAARTVTGSCYVMEVGGRRFAVDCGMHQGNKEIVSRNAKQEFYHPETLDFILVTHAHIDHSGLLPRMVKFGFKGAIYCTSPTRDLLEIMLLDSAHIQEMETAWENTKRKRHGNRTVEPLYTQDDATATMRLFKPVNYNEMFSPMPGVQINFKDAGHILGSSVIEMWVDNGGGTSKIVFSGDLGRPNQLLVRDPSPVGSADFLFLESTYGNRNHKNEAASRDEMAEAIKYSYERKQKVIIPAFAVERSQEVIYCLHLLAKEGRLPQDMPVYLDSPLAIRATEIFRRHSDVFDQDARAMLANGDDPLSLPNLRFTLRSDESQAINTTPGPAVVISASGMCDAGRVKHHLRHNLWREGASVVFVGFQAEGTPGRKIVDGAKSIRLLGEEIAVNAKIFTINGFSAHAGQTQILKWLDYFRTPAMQVFLVHGEYSAQQTLAGLIKEKYGLSVHIPDYLEEIELKPGQEVKSVKDPARTQARIDWNFLLGETDSKMAVLRERLLKAGDKSWVEQTELRDRLVEINNNLVKLISEA